jgi:hypothetical protein
MPPYVSGARTTQSTGLDKLVDMQDFLDFIRDDNMDVALLKRWGINGHGGEGRARAIKTEWSQTALRGRGENVTLADATGTSLTVADARQYQVGELIRIESEVVRVNAIASATVLTITRGYAGTTAAAHAAKLAYSLGKAAEENSVPGAGITDTPVALYNYVQTFDVPVEVSKDQIMSLGIDGNTIDSQLERRFIEVNRQLARALIYGVRFQDTTTLSNQPIRTMGGLLSFLTSNVTNVGGALTIPAIDAQILNIVNAGGNPKTIALSPYQKQKLDALDSNKQFLGKSEHTGGNLITNTWQSGILDHPLDIVVDRTLLSDQLIITDDDMIEPMPFENNGESGAWATYNATAPGQDGKKQVIRGKYTLKVHNEKAHAYLYNLS